MTWGSAGVRMAGSAASSSDIRSMAPAARWISPHRLLSAVAAEPTKKAYIRNWPSWPPVISPASTARDPIQRNSVSIAKTSTKATAISAAFMRMRRTAVAKLRPTASA